VPLEVQEGSIIIPKDSCYWGINLTNGFSWACDCKPQKRKFTMRRGGVGGVKQAKKQTCRRTHRRVSIQRFDAECDWQVNVTGKKESELVSTHLFPPPFFFFLFLLIQNTSNYVSSPFSPPFHLFRTLLWNKHTWSRPKTTPPVPKAENPILDPKKKKKRGEEGGEGWMPKKNRLISSAGGYQIVYWSRIVARCKRFVHRNAHKSVVCNASKRRNKDTELSSSLSSLTPSVDRWMNKEEDDSKPNGMTSTRSAHGSNIHSSPFLLISHFFTFFGCSLNLNKETMDSQQQQQ
jgi:hypothetical protein